MNDSKLLDKDALIRKAKWILTDPSGYFRSMPQSGGFLEPLVFVAVMAFILGVITAIWSLFVSTPAGVASGFLGVIIFTPVAGVLGAFVGAAILFLIWKLMGSSRNYETALRCQSSVAAIYPIVGILAVVPYVGSIIAIAWGAYLMIEASVHVHDRSRGVATTVFGILAVLMILSNTAGERASRQMAEQLDNRASPFDDRQTLYPGDAESKNG